MLYNYIIIIIIIVIIIMIIIIIIIIITQRARLDIHGSLVQTRLRSMDFFRT